MAYSFLAGILGVSGSEVRVFGCMYVHRWVLRILICAHLYRRKSENVQRPPPSCSDLLSKGWVLILGGYEIFLASSPWAARIAFKEFDQ